MQPPAARNTIPNPIESPPRRIVLIGASVRAAAQSAQRAGFLVTGIDLFGDVDTRNACERFFRLDDESQQSTMKIACEGVPSLIVSGLNDLKPYANQLQLSCPPLVGPHEACHPRVDPRVSIQPQSPVWHDERWLRLLAQNAGLGFPETRPCSPHSLDPRGRWLLKAVDSSGGLGVEWLRLPMDRPASKETGSSTPSLQDRKHPPAPGSAKTQIQRWIGGRVVGATFLMSGNQSKLLGVCRSLFTRLPDRPFVYRGSMGPIPTTARLREQLERLGDGVVAETGARGLINADLVIDHDQQPWLLEFNPRWSGSSEVLEQAMMQQGCIESLFGCHIDAMEGRLCSPSLATTQSANSDFVIKRIIFARHPVTFNLQRVEHALRGEATVHDIPPDGTLIQKHDPVCTLRCMFPWKESFETDLPRHKKSPMRKHRAQVIRVLRALSNPEPTCS